MTAASLPRRRFELVFYLMNNRLLTVETATATTSPATGNELKPHRQAKTRKTNKCQRLKSPSSCTK
ncbi:hypothetical protein PF001_g17045 [Phytophthora fragariae]|uniref:Uncharacterized protein n=1 Tax=Phytophthora fragariae TaxID=53985 RepID=A0A6A3SDG2_9STRA|nr:hypothetical protein PF003_g2012 [Phytophthora fragariae]KAE8991315.1 hypothetical protein PF011_g17990 [Phytophthora fragariae]KAE9114270.1 hypothetical protein PF006_g19554 [Phytophthora fragariae]KAE9296051.1 hypothetical protein PF001_g17045 [Phytophthora fragariae]